jgi:sugar O-acyltransferase (sialic acid O-acetyltransferase NeuD family)
VVVGAGGLGREVVETVRAVNAVSVTWDLEGFVDDDTSLPPEIEGVPVLGPTSELAEMPVDVSVVVCVGRPGLNWSRKQVVTKLDLPVDRYATIVHPSAIIPPLSRLGVGSVVLGGVIATTTVTLGAHVVVMPGTIFTHDNRIGDFVTFGAGVRLAGGVSVGEGAYVGAGALVREDRSIGRWSLVGMGAAVTTDIPAGEVWAGVPARFLRSADVPPAMLKEDR